MIIKPVQLFVAYHIDLDEYLYFNIVQQRMEWNPYDNYDNKYLIPKRLDILEESIITTGDALLKMAYNEYKLMAIPVINDRFNHYHAIKL